MVFSGKYLRIIILGAFLLITGCGVEDSLRNWGERQRRRRVDQLSESDLEKWQKDFAISRERAIELNKTIQSFVQESDKQGRLAYQIAQSFMKEDRYEIALQYFNAALENRMIEYGANPAGRLTLFETPLPFFNEALLRNPISNDLLFDAGLCYANASKDLGWEAQRWKRAVALFEILRQRDPKHTGPPFQLALLYGKITDENLRDVDKALELLRELLKINESDISARFALANILTENRMYGEAREQYIRIQEILKDMYDSGVIKGRVSKNQQYIQAGKNRAMLDNCMEGHGPCDIGGF